MPTLDVLTTRTIGESLSSRQLYRSGLCGVSALSLYEKSMYNSYVSESIPLSECENRRSLDDKKRDSVIPLEARASKLNKEVI